MSAAPVRSPWGSPPPDARDCGATDDSESFHMDFKTAGELSAIMNAP
jgi:hypothetical protein